MADFEHYLEPGMWLIRFGRPDVDATIRDMSKILQVIDPAPWIPDIDDPDSDHPEFTGKFYWGGEGNQTEQGTWDCYNSPTGLPNDYNKNQIRNIQFCAAARVALPILIPEIKRLQKEVLRKENLLNDANQEIRRLQQHISQLEEERMDSAYERED